MGGKSKYWVRIFDFSWEWWCSAHDLYGRSMVVCMDLGSRIFDFGGQCHYGGVVQWCSSDPKKDKDSNHDHALHLQFDPKRSNLRSSHSRSVVSRTGQVGHCLGGRLQEWVENKRSVYFHRFGSGEAGGPIDSRVGDFCNHVGFTA
jgi:hypothetical protein